jgi:hypothetical protein
LPDLIEQDPGLPGSASPDLQQRNGCAGRVVADIAKLRPWAALIRAASPDFPCRECPRHRRQAQIRVATECLWASSLQNANVDLPRFNHTAMRAFADGGRQGSRQRNQSVVTDADSLAARRRGPEKVACPAAAGVAGCTSGLPGGAGFRTRELPDAGTFGIGQFRSTPSNRRTMTALA